MEDWLSFSRCSSRPSQKPTSRLSCTGAYISDTVKLGDFQTAPTFSFGCASSVALSGGSGNNPTGLLGFSPSALATPGQLTRDSGFSPVFSLCLSPTTSQSSTLFLGGVPAVPNLAFDFTPQNVAQQDYNHWQILPPTGFLVNGVSVGPIVAGDFSDWIIDSGSTLTFLPASLLNPIAQTLRTVTGLRVFFSLPDSGGSQSLYIVLSDALGFGLTDAEYLAYLPPISLQLPGVTLTAQPKDYRFRLGQTTEFSDDKTTPLVVVRTGLKYQPGVTILGSTFFNDHLVSTRQQLLNKSEPAVER